MPYSRGREQKNDPDLPGLMPFHHNCKGPVKPTRENSQIIHMEQQIDIFPNLHSLSSNVLYLVICHGY